MLWGKKKPPEKPAPGKTKGPLTVHEERLRETDPRLRTQSSFDDGLSVARGTMGAKLANPGMGNPASAIKQLQADRSFARIEQIRGGHGLLIALGIMNGVALKGLGEKLDGPELRKARDVDVDQLRQAVRSANNKVVGELFVVIAENATGEPRALLKAPGLAEALMRANRTADLLAHLKASSWHSGMEVLRTDVKLADFVEKALAADTGE